MCEVLDLVVSGSGQGPMTNAYEHINEPSCFIKGREFYDQLSNFHLLKKCCAL
jgi:hypothetical protein